MLFAHLTTNPPPFFIPPPNCWNCWIGLVSCWEKNCGSGGAFVSLWINWRNVRSTVLHQRNGGELITLKFI